VRKKSACYAFGMTVGEREMESGGFLGFDFGGEKGSD